MKTNRECILSLYTGHFIYNIDSGRLWLSILFYIIFSQSKPLVAFFPLDRIKCKIYSPESLCKIKDKSSIVLLKQFIFIWWSYQSRWDHSQFWGVRVGLSLISYVVLWNLLSLDRFFFLAMTLSAGFRLKSWISLW